MTDFLSLAESRYSVRSFTDRKVEPEKLEKILQAGRVAPTAVNNQPQVIYVLQSPEALAKMGQATKYLFGAPQALLVCYDENICWKNRHHEDAGRPSGEVDASIVLTHMMLQAWELGIGSCWIGAFQPSAVAEAFGIPANEHPVAILPLGYPADGCRPSDKHTSFRDAEDYIKIL